MEAPSYNFSPIGFIRSSFKEKFGLPRQSMMMSQSLGVLKLNDDPQLRLAVKDLQNFSHLWVIFVFHRHLYEQWTPTTTPPRIDGPKTVGVLASRSPYRPNPIGMSALKIERIDFAAAGGVEIHLSGLDILDETPVLDIKPYLPYADRIADANSGWVPETVYKYPVSFSEAALIAIEQITAGDNPNFKEFLTQILELDPRPTSLRRNYPIAGTKIYKRKFGFRVLDYEIKCEIQHGGLHVLDILFLKERSLETDQNCRITM